MLVELTRKELCFIDDSVTLLRDIVNISESKDKIVQRVLAPMATTPAPISLITKIGMSLLEAIENENQGKMSVATIDLEEDELLTIREVAHTGAVYDEERVGLNLKVKVHEGLRRIAREKVLGDLPTGSVEETDFNPSMLDAYYLLEDDD